MPLYINGSSVDHDDECHPENIFKCYPDLHSKSEAFMKKAVMNQKEINGREHRLLYVLQREYAVISKNLNKGSFDYIASDEATTCHLMILKEPFSETIALAHFDGTDLKNGIDEIITNVKLCHKLVKSKIETDDKHLKANQENNILNLELYLFGGFVDSKHYSENVFRDILKVCTHLKDNIELKLACCYSLNNKYIHGNNWPILIGVSVCMKSLEFSIATCTNHGPDILLRRAKMHSIDPSLNSNIYDFEDGYVFCKPFSFHSSRYAMQLLRLCDKEFLKYCSTSPHCEPKHFVKMSKAVILFTVKYSNHSESIFRGITRRCFLDEHFDWHYKDGCHSILDV